MTPPLIRQIRFQLQMLDALLQQLDTPGYGTPVPVLGNSSIGMHVRHILEFYQCLRDGCADGMVNYDRRKRDVATETDLLAAGIALKEVVHFVNSCTVNASVRLLSGEEEGDKKGLIAIDSSLFRELLYNLEHTIHHLAMIRIALRATGMEHLVAERFGVAPSTLRSGRVCVR
ncbi:hypothetical protein [Robertkochia sediminum]|uniref:hypothetical protein n=1 Tax=Robertkochia sediminum TaxID=2785326 RepID=UPI00193294F1|nr:hypothetical protein [Robertkochia sediminum]MBL7472644.1 hypothetical protein [Robertkochia sediminum]